MPTESTIAQTETVANAQPGWSQALAFAQFDPSLGTLLDVQVTTVGTVAATAAVENLGPAAATVDVSVPTAITVEGVDVSADVEIDPTAQLNLGAYDGTTNYAGSSGTVVPLTGSQTAQSTFTLTGTAAAAFTGTGTVDLTAASSAGSKETGDANLVTLLQADAGAAVSVVYDYAPVTSTSGSGTEGEGGDTFSTVGIVQSAFIFAIPNTQTTAPATYTVPNSPSGWSDLLAVQPFNTSLGTLEAVDLTLSGGFTGTLAAQRLDSSIIDLDVTEQATVTIDLGSFSSLSSTAEATVDSPVTVNSGSTLGATLAGVSPSQPAQETITDPTLLAEFSGGNPVEVPISSIGASTVTGGANLLTYLSQDAGATLTVSYVYDPASVACFATGTKIATPDGSIAVEHLTVGQTVLTQAGRHAPIVWIGHRHVNCTRHPDPAKVCPIRIRAEAFGPNQPARDLFLSPDHAVAQDGVLIPIASLVNGHTIARTPRESVTYWHVELDRHDVLLAEGLPVESFLDTGNRGAFANGGPTVQLHPAFNAWSWEAAGCAPLVVIGPALDAVRARLADRIPERSEAA